MPEESGRGLSGIWSRLGALRPTDATPESTESARVQADAPVYATKALKKFLAAIGQRESPVLLDLGPVIGTNVTFFGETLGCKVFIEDLYTDLERHSRNDTLGELPALIERRFTQRPGSVDGILAWDIFDYLDPASAQALAATLTKLLSVDGALLGFFSTAAAKTVPSYTKFIVVDEHSLRHREYPATRTRQRVLQNRDIIKLFEGLRVSDSFLLQTNLREILFKKPAYLAAG